MIFLYTVERLWRLRCVKRKLPSLYILFTDYCKYYYAHYHYICCCLSMFVDVNAIDTEFDLMLKQINIIVAIRFYCLEIDLVEMSIISIRRSFSQ